MILSLAAEANLFRPAANRIIIAIRRHRAHPGKRSSPCATQASPGGFYAGNVAAVTRKLGKGTVTYIGVESSTGALEKGILREIFGTAGISVRNFDNQFLVDWRDGFWIAANFTEKKQTAPVPDNAKIVIGTRELAPAGIAVWIENGTNFERELPEPTARAVSAGAQPY